MFEEIKTETRETRQEEHSKVEYLEKINQLSDRDKHFLEGYLFAVTMVDRKTA